MRSLIVLAALLLAGPCLAALVDLPVTRIKVAPACEERTVAWTQSGTVASWTLEIRRIFSAGGQPAYDTPTTHTILGTSPPQWKGVLRDAGVYQVRVRANYVENGTTKATTWAESTDAAAAVDGQSFVFVLFLCPPGGFTPN